MVVTFYQNLMKKIVNRVLLAMLIVPLLSCIDLIDIEGPRVAKRLVVEGWITNDPELSYVQLSYTVPFSNTFPYTASNPPISKANVRIISDDMRTIIRFRETSPGHYTAMDVGEIGTKYILEIIIDDKFYRSDAQEMMAVPTLERLGYELVQKTSVRENATGSFFEVKEYAFEVYAYSEDPANENNYYYWKANGITEILTKPVGDLPCDECTCYFNDNSLNQGIRLEDDELINGSNFRKKVATVPLNRITKYWTNVYQYSLTRDAFEYWNKVYDQHENVGSIFDPAPSQIQGNIYAVSPSDIPEDKDEIVYGFFFASAVSKQDLLLDRSLEAGKLGIVPQNLIPLEEGDCRQLFPGSYSEPVPPPFQH